MSENNAVRVRVRAVELFERPVVLRLPFRFGAATVTRCPQAFVRMEAEVGGAGVFTGATAELMVPKWFDKSPALTHEQNFEQLRQALRLAREAYLAEDTPLSPHGLSTQAGDAAVALGVAQGLPRLAAQFGAAQLDKAVADAALRAAGLGWCEGVAAGVLGDPWSALLSRPSPSRIDLRHTVGLADRLTRDEPGPDPKDGLPATLEDAIATYGLRWFKLKLSGRAEADLDRLARIAGVLQSRCGQDGWRVTLDGNETFASAEALGEFWRRLAGEPRLAALLQRTALLEQPIARAAALRERIDGLGIGVPVILDESDDHPEALDQGLALGYRGISSKACKGIYRSLRNAAHLRGVPGGVLSGEDLTCQAGLAVQQDTLLAASLGMAHVERNGHHYVDGFGAAPTAEVRSFETAHPGLYEGGRLAVRGGALDLRSLHGPGFGHAAEPVWAGLAPMR